MALETVAGIVFSPPNDYVVAWVSGLGKFLHQRGYRPQQFRDELKVNSKRAIAIAHEMLKIGTELYGAPTTLGLHMGGDSYHRFQIGGQVGDCTSMTISELRIS